MEVAQIYRDMAVGAASNQKSVVVQKGKKAPKSEISEAPRSQWQQLLTDCQIEAVDYVLVRRLEDLGDSMPAISDRLSELETLGISLFTLEDLTSEDLKFDPTENLPELLQPEILQAKLVQRLQTLAQNQRSHRLRQGHARNRIKALPPPGKAPYGYRRSKNGYIIDRSVAPVVKDFFEQFLLYGSVRGAVRYLAKRYGKKISASTGQRWLTNPVYRGDLEYQDGSTIRDTHAALISRDEAAQIDRLLRRNRRLPPRAATAPRSLAGLVVCSDCQSSMTITRVTAHKSAQEYLYLRPRNCPNAPKCSAIDYQAVLQKTIERICEDLPRTVSGVELPDMVQIKQGLTTAIANKQAILQQIPSLVETQILDPETADLRAYKLRTEMAAMQDQLSQLPPVDLKAIAQTLSIPQFWLDLSESERRVYFREFIRQIQLLRPETGWELKLNFFFSRSI
jgi:DNA invertase Pin-like site-specific DNA recombinase